MNATECPKRHGRYFLLSLLTGLLCCHLLTAALPACAEEQPADEPYHTPLAGEAKTVHFLGRTIQLPAIDRGYLTSLSLGGSFFTPKVGSTVGVPAGALFVRRLTDDYRSRDAISLVVNELEVALRDDLWELVGHFESYSLPVDIKELRDNSEIKQTSLIFGDLMASLGPGLRTRVAPYDVDNDLRLQLLGRVGYQYAKKTSDTGSDVVVPPDTFVWGGRFRARYDGLSRNLLELPHRGLAAGLDVDLTHRDRWTSLSPTGTGSVNRDYLQVKGYIEGAGGIPGLSEKDRVMVHLGGGTTEHGDRFNAFQINGGPFPSEADDLARPHYTGIFYQDVRATKYATASIAYRRELTFFLYLSLIGSYIWAERATVEGIDQVVFRSKTGFAGTVNLDCAFIWNSAIYLGFTHDDGFIRNGRSGNGVVLLWSKML
ncbi:porin [Geomonas sp.]|uniref:porin n=1 Tax=Geomonas sp. TaxID=2651584 RepID=UPI002B4701CD|nr:porin [Geomonas sp.]HJV35766.1 porin [Geomonas sp.]